MEQKNLPLFLVIFGAGAVVVAALGFLLASLVRGAGAPAPTSTPVTPTAYSTPSPVASPTPAPATDTPVSTTDTSESATGTPVTATETPAPTPNRTIPEVAPDFTLEQSGGGAFTLSEQLADGPAVLVFFQRGGG